MKNMKKSYLSVESIAIKNEPSLVFVMQMDCFVLTPDYKRHQWNFSCQSFSWEDLFCSWASVVHRPPVPQGRYAGH